MTYNIPKPHKPLLQQTDHLIDSVLRYFPFPKCNNAVLTEWCMGIKVGNEAVMSCFPLLGETRVGRVFDVWFGIDCSTTARSGTRDILFQTVSSSHETIPEVSAVAGI